LTKSRWREEFNATDERKKINPVKVRSPLHLAIESEIQRLRNPLAMGNGPFATGGARSIVPRVSKVAFRRSNAPRPSNRPITARRLFVNSAVSRQLAVRRRKRATTKQIGLPSQLTCGGALISYVHGRTGRTEPAQAGGRARFTLWNLNC